MADMTLEQFELDVTSTCAASPAVTGIAMLGAGITWIHLRVYLTDGSFADAFYNQATGKTAFALIKAGERIFGADNTGGWHWHPFAEPASHVPSSRAIIFREFLGQIEQQLAGHHS
jgi:hypothetical protein